MARTKTAPIPQPVMVARDYARARGMNYRVLLRWMQHGEQLANGQVVKFPCIPLANGKYLVLEGALEKFAQLLEVAATDHSTPSQAGPVAGS